MGKWETVQFADVLEIVNGRNQKQVENPNGKYPIYGSGGVMGYADDYLCDAETVVIGRKGTISRPIFVSEPFWNVDTAFGLSAKQSVLIPKYLYYFCKQFDFEALNTTVTIPSLTKANLLKIQIPLPPLTIQQKIAEALDKASALIEMRKAQIEKLDLLIKSQFIEMFGDPVTNPLGLAVNTLSDLALIKAGRNETSDNIHELSSEFNYPCFGGNGIRGYVKEYTYEGDYPLIGRQGALCGNVQFASGRFFPTEHALVVSPIVDYESKWMYFTLKYLNLNRFQTGAAQPGLNVDIINKIVIPTPSREKQKLFTDFLMLVEKQRKAIEDSLRGLELNYRSLMQKCFCGEIF